MTISEATDKWFDGEISDGELLQQALAALILAQEAIELVKMSIEDRRKK